MSGRILKQPLYPFQIVGLGLSGRLAPSGIYAALESSFLN